ncbi:ferredoxin [Gemelliphila palaticanis]|uniref:Ferredoxin n=1 Tax=Gemelliphila palaticanis TaxID=81950 RepID=A0ABX2T189_9BACL|nr:ferredoxin [Gemella palaticanis]MBF0715284.1 ferredoxin [Gemella palaticanis]NYS47214.1 ferredoxin [Gemella palaticanis]
MKTKVNRETCISCGNCYSICPEIFECDEEGIAFCHLDNNKMEVTIDAYLEKSLIDCVECCPTESILVRK